MFCIQINQKETKKYFPSQNPTFTGTVYIIYNCSHLKVTLTQPQTKFNSNTNDST